MHPFQYDLAISEETNFCLKLYMFETTWGLVNDRIFIFGLTISFSQDETVRHIMWLDMIFLLSTSDVWGCRLHSFPKVQNSERCVKISSIPDQHTNMSLHGKLSPERLSLIRVHAEWTTPQSGFRRDCGLRIWIHTCIRLLWCFEATVSHIYPWLTSSQFW